MKPALLLFTALALAPSSVIAQDAPLVLVIDGRIDGAALRRELGEALEREVVALDDARAARAADTLSLASADGRRWVLRYDRAARTAWRTAEVARGETLAEALVGASRALVTEDWARTSADVVDPFAPERWDPLRSALRAELMTPFVRSADYAFAELLDPFDAAGATTDVLDPWAGR